MILPDEQEVLERIAARDRIRFIRVSRVLLEADHRSEGCIEVLSLTASPDNAWEADLDLRLVLPDSVR